MKSIDSLQGFWELLEEASGTRVDAHGANDLTDNNTVLQGTGKVGNWDMEAVSKLLGYRFETNADGTEERMYRPDGTLALIVRKPKEKERIAASSEPQI